MNLFDLLRLSLHLLCADLRRRRVLITQGVLVRRDYVRFYLKGLDLVRRSTTAGRSNNVRVLALTCHLDRRQRNAKYVTRPSTNSNVRRVHLCVLDVRLRDLVTCLQRNDVILRRVHRVHRARRCYCIVDLYLQSFLRLNMDLLRITGQSMNAEGVITAFRVVYVRLRDIFRELNYGIGLVRTRDAGAVVFRRIRIFFLLLFRFLDDLLTAG